VSNVFTGAAVSLGFAYYLAPWAPERSVPWIAAGTCVAFTALNARGMRQSTRVNNALVAVKLAILVFFCGLGVFYSRLANLEPFEPLRASVLTAAGYIFFAYGGFARVTVVAEEVLDARRNVPRAILLSLAVSTAVYVAVGLIALGLVGPGRLAASRAPLADAISAVGRPSAVVALSVGAMVATASVLLTSILGVSRMVYAMARHGDLPAAMAALDPKRATPSHAVWLTGLAMAVLALVGDLGRVVTVSTFALLFYYGVANVCAARLTVEARRYPRIVPVAGVATCVGLMSVILVTTPGTWALGTAALAAGSVFYAARRGGYLARPGGGGSP
jgi:APA family basic amino acid/polyamine antiporter